jgi:hypothetical protein
MGATRAHGVEGAHGVEEYAAQGPSLGGLLELRVDPGPCLVPRSYELVVLSLFVALAIDLALRGALVLLEWLNKPWDPLRATRRRDWQTRALQSATAVAIALSMLHPRIPWADLFPCGVWSALAFFAWVVAFRTSLGLLARVPGVEAEIRRCSRAMAALAPYVVLQLCWMHFFASVGILVWGRMPLARFDGTSYAQLGYVDAMHFGDYQHALMLLFHVLCQNNWSVTAGAYVYVSGRAWPLAWGFFVLYLYLHALLLLNVLTGALIELYSAMRRHDELEQMAAIRQKPPLPPSACYGWEAAPCAPCSALKREPPPAPPVGRAAFRLPWRRRARNGQASGSQAARNGAGAPGADGLGCSRDLEARAGDGRGSTALRRAGAGPVSLSSGSTSRAGSTPGSSKRCTVTAATCTCATADGRGDSDVASADSSQISAASRIALAYDHKGLPGDVMRARVCNMEEDAPASAEAVMW